jgi:hypothetical protein
MPSVSRNIEITQCFSNYDILINTDNRLPYCDLFQVVQTHPRVLIIFPPSSQLNCERLKSDGVEGLLGRLCLAPYGPCLITELLKVEGLVFEGMKAGVNTVKNPRSTQERIFKYIRLKQESHLSSAKQR